MGGDGKKPRVVLIGTLDTKGAEYDFLAGQVRSHGVDVVLIDVGIHEPQITPDITRHEVGAATGMDVAALSEAGDRGEATSAMADALTAFLPTFVVEHNVAGVLGLGGSGGSSIVTSGMRALPVGVPKLMVSTLASGDTRPYVGAVDITMMYSVVDIAGVNRVSARIMANAAGAIAGMAKTVIPATDDRPLIGATMFGVTTPAVTRARERLEELGYEVLVFHATGTGGRSMEALVRDGFLTGVLDLTTTELADEVVGGVLSAGPDRLEAAGAAGIPQVVSLGALDMVNFGPRDSVPERFAERQLYVHNPTITLMRTTAEECREIGRLIGSKLSAATGPTALFIPLGGISMIAEDGQPFHDPQADAALLEGLESSLDDTVTVTRMDAAINDPEFAVATADALHDQIQTR